MPLHLTSQSFQGRWNWFLPWLFCALCIPSWIKETVNNALLLQNCRAWAIRVRAPHFSASTPEFVPMNTSICWWLEVAIYDEILLPLSLLKSRVEVWVVTAPWVMRRQPIHLQNHDKKCCKLYNNHSTAWKNDNWKVLGAQNSAMVLYLFPKRLRSTSSVSS